MGTLNVHIVHTNKTPDENETVHAHRLTNITETVTVRPPSPLSIVMATAASDEFGDDFVWCVRQ